MANKLVKIVKTALAAKYGHTNVSVKNGTGTAWGWVDAEIKIDATPDIKNIYADADKIAHDAVKNAGEKFYTYPSDDGRGADSDCFLLRITQFCTTEKCVLNHQCLSGCQKDYDCPCLANHPRKDDDK